MNSEQAERYKAMMAGYWQAHLPANSSNRAAAMSALHRGADRAQVAGHLVPSNGDATDQRCRSHAA